MCVCVVSYNIILSTRIKEFIFSFKNFYTKIINYYYIKSELNKLTVAVQSSCVRTRIIYIGNNNVVNKI